MISPVTPPLSVLVANGSHMSCSSQIVDAFWFIQGQQFVSTLKVLELQQYDMIIGMDWFSNTQSNVGPLVRQMAFPSGWLIFS
jgi:hypothetical protein